MRYRIKKYSASVSNNVITLSFDVPNGMVISINPDDGSLDTAGERLIKESVRLIIDETNKVVLCSSMQKNRIINIYAQGNQGESTADTIYIRIAIPEDKTVSASDQFTIEMDWGDTIKDHIPTDYAKEVTLGDVQDVLEYIEQGGMPEIDAIAKQGTNPNATLSEVLIQTTSAAADAAAAKVAAQAITGYALQGGGNATQTDIASAIGTPVTGQPSTLFAAIAAGGDATVANQQIIIDAVKDGNDTTIDVVKDIDIYGAKEATVAKEATATANKNQVISAIGNTLNVNMLATGLSSMAGVPMNVITDDGVTATYTLNANELYYFNNRFSDLELTLDLTTVNQGDAADFHLIVQVAVGASPLTVTIRDSDDNDVVWSWNIVPHFSAGVIYEIGIINNLALYVNYDV